MIGDMEWTGHVLDLQRLQSISQSLNGSWELGSWNSGLPSCPSPKSAHLLWGRFTCTLTRSLFIQPREDKGTALTNTIGF